MGRIVYCNGDFMPEEDARISIFDRGFLFGDAIYEVTAVLAGRLIDNDLHLDRLERSLAALSIPMPTPRSRLEQIQAELMARNGLSEGTIYLQVSRGEADRDFLYPEGLAPNFVAFTQARKLADTPAQRNGIAVDLAEDPRWARRDIKTAMLLGQVLAKRQARAAGYDDVWMVEDGLVTEGASSTAFIITTDGRVVTRPNSRSTLPGCTRKAVLRLCGDHGLRLEERGFSPDEAGAAAEAFATSASSFVMPVVKIAGSAIGDGRPGPMTRRLQSYYIEAALNAEPLHP
ncbi:D-amino-acid transaminase [Mesorhizobium sp. VK25A]|uniref:Probable branched-chain-amino-acid aminotransferase n=1 Tax=Mesorhizobium vachelliae TaxID=3072309 RepID=A0ABU5A6S1_9HYPH|nr:MULTISPECIES: D-amino-acid transaminase [unclassified Mesorhizobium]MDX8532852.1 D-amino-acid transaminase [Mesorhizobium sp. VK25D]MDX8544642.1 D-amino-acid transaminase [Mesorhizobium sp. VK25A]